MEGILFFFLILSLGFILLRFIKNSRKKFSPKRKEEIKNHLTIIQSFSLREKVLEMDKILDECLKEKGYSGSLGEKMKRHGQGFVSENAIWSAHKLRNKLAHEMGFVSSEKEMGQAISAFLVEIETLVR